MTRPPTGFFDDPAPPLRGQTFLIAAHGTVEQPGMLWRAKGRLPNVTINSPRRRSERTASLAPSPVAAVRQEKKDAGSGESPEPDRWPVGVYALIWLRVCTLIWLALVALAYGAGAFIAWLTW